MMHLRTFCCRFPVCVFIGVSCRAENHWEVLCNKGSKERRGPDGRWCGVHYGREESSVSCLGASLPHTPLLHLSDQGLKKKPVHREIQPKHVFFKHKISILLFRFCELIYLCLGIFHIGEPVLRDGVSKRGRFNVPHSVLPQIWSPALHVRHSYWSHTHRHLRKEIHP